MIAPLSASLVAASASKTAYGLICHIKNESALDYKMIAAGCDSLYMLAAAAPDHAQLGYHLASINDAILDLADNDNRINHDAVASALYCGSGL
jgi:hypothetical protein